MAKMTNKYFENIIIVKGHKSDLRFIFFQENILLKASVEFYVKIFVFSLLNHPVQPAPICVNS